MSANHESEVRLEERLGLLLVGECATMSFNGRLMTR